MMVKQKRNKDTICATVSPYVKRRVLELVDSDDFSSMSDLVSVAVTDFIARYDSKPRNTEKNVIKNDAEKNNQDGDYETDYLLD